MVVECTINVGFYLNFGAFMQRIMISVQTKREGEMC